MGKSGTTRKGWKRTGREVTCSLCGKPAGYRFPSALARSKTFRCKQHADRNDDVIQCSCRGCGRGFNTRPSVNSSLMCRSYCTRCRQRVKARLAGVPARASMLPHMWPQWKGGRVVFCSVCDDPVGYRWPAEIKRSKTVRCEKCRFPRFGREVSCSECGKALGYRQPAELAKRRSFQCRAHRVRRKRTGQEVTCSVCHKPAGYRKLSKIARGGGFRCKACDFVRLASR